MARRCFSDPSLFAECLELDYNLVKHIALILICFKSKKRLDLDKLEKFCFETYALHYTLYPWSRINPSTHKLLRHGCAVSRKFPLPIAFYSEDSSEAWHKLNRRNMKQRARQNSRQNRILDVLNRAMYLSDPKVSLEHITNRLKFRKQTENGLEGIEGFL